ncbi:MAG TPA: hypothetical protein VJ989_04235 [Solirubrobacterales bacterium]|nr:hypothetical protein [Solirubrobacterales bacterium]
MRGNHIGVRKGLISVFVLAGMAALGVAGAASAVKLTTTTVRAGDLQVTFGGGLHQRTLPKHRFEAFKHTIFGTIKTTDGTHPSAFRELDLNIDKDVKINTKGFPVCRPDQLEARDTKAARRVCGKAIVGNGSAHAEIAFPEQAPIKVLSPLLIFNGGESGGKITLLAHTFITVPAPAAIVTRVTVQRQGTGVHAIAKIPVIAGGSGSAVDFKFTLGKTYRYKRRQVGYFEARCPDGVFKVRSRRALFKNETGTPGVAAQTVLRGGLGVPCVGKG